MGFGDHENPGHLGGCVVWTIAKFRRDRSDCASTFAFVGAVILAPKVSLGKDHTTLGLRHTGLRQKGEGLVMMAAVVSMVCPCLPDGMALIDVVVWGVS